MRHALAVVTLVHGIAHLVGFAVAWRLVSAADLPYRTTIVQGRVDIGDLGIRLYGLGWLGLAIGFAVMAIGIFVRAPWWVSTGPILILISLVCCVLSWPDTRLGVIANVLVLGMILASFRFGGGSMPVSVRDLESLWEVRPVGATEVFDPEDVRGLPPEVRRYLERVIAPGASLTSTVRLTMEGEIKLNEWHRFRAEQVLSKRDGFVWAAAASVYGLPVIGADQLLQEKGSMEWKMMGLLPVATAEGPNVTRSAIGRFQAELVSWLPAVLLDKTVSWAVLEGGRVLASREVCGERTDVELDIRDEGRLRTVRFRRWGNPGEDTYRYENFGVIVDEERVFGGFIIPSRIRAGWFFGTARFAEEGEFFRATIKNARFE